MSQDRRVSRKDAKKRSEWRVASELKTIQHSYFSVFFASLRHFFASLRETPPVRINPLPPLNFLGWWAAELVEAAAELPAEGGVELAEGVAFVEIKLSGDANPA